MLNYELKNKIYVKSMVANIKSCHHKQFEKFKGVEKNVLIHSSACLPNFYLSFPFEKSLMGKIK